MSSYASLYCVFFPSLLCSHFVPTFCSVNEMNTRCSSNGLSHFHHFHFLSFGSCFNFLLAFIHLLLSPGTAIHKRRKKERRKKNEKKRHNSSIHCLIRTNKVLPHNNTLFLQHLRIFVNEYLKTGKTECLSTSWKQYEFCFVFIYTRLSLVPVSSLFWRTAKEENAEKEGKELK